MYYLCFLRNVGIATLVRRVNRPNVTVGVDGSLYRFHPEFERILTNTVNELLRNKYNVSTFASLSPRTSYGSFQSLFAAFLFA